MIEKLRSKEWATTPRGFPTYVNRTLKARGYVLLGSGMSGQAWLTPNHQQVLKVALKSDKPYQKFVAFCQKVNNKHLPKIFNTAFTQDRQLFLVLTELLQPADEITEHAVQILVDIASGDGGPNKNTLYFIKKDKLDLNEIQKLADVFKPTLLPLITVLAKKNGGYNTIDDAYTNVMMRGSTPVLIDPWAN